VRLRLLSAPALVMVVLAVALAAWPSRRRANAQTVKPSARGMDGDFADPFVLRAGDGYYAFATGAHGWNLQLATSPDLATWTLVGDPVPKLPGWAVRKPGLTWAPAVLPRGTSYVLYYTTRHRASGFQCISRALASRPEGPYLDTSSQPLVCQVEAGAGLCGSIDPSPFVDGDGQAYLLWKSDENSTACHTAPRIWSQRLSDDGLALRDTPSVLLTRDRPWEGDIVEGPSMLARGGVYYLFYSANWYASSAYAVGYATCTSPRGGCRKVTLERPFLASAGTTMGPGGQELFTAADGKVWMAYHAWTGERTSYEAGGARSLRLARVDFSTEGQPLAANLP
jgi:beta-xylosidase